MLVAILVLFMLVSMLMLIFVTAFLFSILMMIIIILLLYSRSVVMPVRLTWRVSDNSDGFVLCKCYWSVGHAVTHDNHYVDVALQYVVWPWTWLVLLPPLSFASSSSYPLSSRYSVSIHSCVLLSNLRYLFVTLYGSLHNIMVFSCIMLFWLVVCSLWVYLSSPGTLTYCFFVRNFPCLSRLCDSWTSGFGPILKRLVVQKSFFSIQMLFICFFSSVHR